MKLICGVRCRV